MKIRVARAPSLLMTTLVGGAIGAAAGIAVGDKALRYGALGAALGLAGSFAYAIYNTRSVTEQALVEHQALIAASIKAPPATPARVTRPSLGPVPHHAGGIARGGWDRGITSALHVSPMVPTYPHADYQASPYSWE